MLFLRAKLDPKYIGEVVVCMTVACDAVYAAAGEVLAAVTFSFPLAGSILIVTFFGLGVLAT